MGDLPTASASGIGCHLRTRSNLANLPTGWFYVQEIHGSQHNYHVFEMETIAILEALLKVGR